MQLPIFSSSFKEFLISIKKESRIARLILSVFQLHNDGFKNMLPRVLTTKNINYITYRSDGDISFLPSGKEHIVNDDNTWSRTNRQSGKPARVIRKLFTDKMLELLNEKDFEIFNNHYKCKFDTSRYAFDLLPNTEIKRIYDMDIEEGGSSLNNSCMNRKGNFLNIYENCKQLEILVLLNNNYELAGRALIWTIDDIILMDRVYVTQDYLYDLFVDHAKSNTWWYKQDYKSMHDRRTFIDSNGEVVYNKYFTIHTDTEFNSYPYIDTFCYGEYGYLTNQDVGEYEYLETSGDRNDPDNGRVYDDIDECDIDEEDSVTITAGESRYVDLRTHYDNTVCIGDEYYYSEDSNIVCLDGDWYDINSDYVVEINGEYYHVDACVFDEYNQEDALEDNCVYSDSMGGYILKDEAYKVNDAYYHESEVEKL